MNPWRRLWGEWWCLEPDFTRWSSTVGLWGNKSHKSMIVVSSERCSSVASRLTEAVRSDEAVAAALSCSETMFSIFWEGPTLPAARRGGEERRRCGGGEERTGRSSRTRRFPSRDSSALQALSSSVLPSFSRDFKLFEQNEQKHKQTNKAWFSCWCSCVYIWSLVPVWIAKDLKWKVFKLWIIYLFSRR